MDRRLPPGTWRAVVYTCVGSFLLAVVVNVASLWLAFPDAGGTSDDPRPPVLDPPQPPNEPTTTVTARQLARLIADRLDLPPEGRDAVVDVLTGPDGGGVQVVVPAPTTTTPPTSTTTTTTTQPPTTTTRPPIHVPTVDEIRDLVDDDYVPTTLP